MLAGRDGEQAREKHMGKGKSERIGRVKERERGGEEKGK